MSLQRLVKNLLLDPSYLTALIPLILLCELFLNLIIVWKVRYTEIDWKAYMQEVQGVLDGQWDYLELRGGTGPLVYPAGFVYIFAALHRLTGADPLCCRLPPDAVTESDRCVSGGGDVRLAQYVFIGVYLCTHAIVLDLYRRSRACPPWALALLCLSLRVHSLYSLRLFNDCVAMLLMYAAVHAFVRARWTTGAVVFSLAVSVKMNCVLIAPGVAIVMLRAVGWAGSIWRGLLFGLVQLLLAVPFLRANASGYLGKAFELSRVFDYKWTVNLKFLAPPTFQSPTLSAALLGAHVLLLLAFAHRRWCAADGGLPRLLLLGSDASAPSAAAAKRAGGGGGGGGGGAGGGGRGGTVAEAEAARAHDTLLTLLGCNYIGIVVSRTLHYQFYVWYFHTVPLLLWAAPLRTPVRLLLWGGIELAFNVFPATAASSALLQVCHWVLLVALWRAPATPDRPHRD